jgi:hypothetical protein
MAGVTNITHPAYYSTVHDAVGAALDGDTLLVSTGRYAPDWISLGAKRLQILGGYRLDFSAQLGANSVLDGNAYVAAIGGGTCLLQRLTLTGALNGYGLQGNSSAIITCQYCTISGNTNTTFGAGIRIISGARVVLENTTVENNATTTPSDGDGAGIYINSGALLIGNGCSVQNNTAAARGGGLFASGVAVDIAGTTDIIGNYAPQGGGIYARAGALVSVHDNADVRGNYAGGDGGGVYVSNATLLVYDANSYVGYPYAANGRNVATNDGGNIYAQRATVIISNGAACANGLARSRGGALYLTNSTLLLAGGGDVGTFNGNYPDSESDSHGGAVFAIGSTVSAGSGSHIAFGRAGISGGGLYAYDTRVLLSGARVLSNWCASLGAGVMLSGACHAEITNTWFAGNDAGSRGGALYATGGTNLVAILVSCTLSNNSAVSDGGAIRWYTTGALTARNCLITYNRSGSDGGALAADSYAGSMVFEDGTIRRNTADGNGGACAIASGTLRAQNTHFHYNFADNDDSGSGDGGAIYATAGAQVARIGTSASPDIYANRAVNGAGLAVYNNATAVVENAGGIVVEVYANTADAHGGGIAVNNAVLQMGPGVLVNDNRAAFGAGLFATNGAAVEITGTTGQPVRLYGNIAAQSGGGLYVAGSRTIARLQTVILGESFHGLPIANIARGGSGHGGGGAAVVSQARLEAGNCWFLNNVSSNNGGGVYASAADVAISSVFSGGPVARPLTRLWNNRALYGGAVYAGGGSVTMADAEIVSNQGVRAAGGVELLAARGSIINCVFAGNMASNAAALAAVFGGTVSVTHCSIALNATNAIVTDLGGGCGLTNCIVYDNTGLQITPGNIVRFSDVQGGYAGAGNFSASPLFAAPATLDFQLSLGSPCIDTGMPAGVMYDIVGVVRPFGSAPDLGAYEFVPEPAGLGLLAAFTIYNLQVTIWKKRRRGEK